MINCHPIFGNQSKREITVVILESLQVLFFEGGFPNQRHTTTFMFLTHTTHTTHPVHKNHPARQSTVSFV